jgi:hypothetical protein
MVRRFARPCRRQRLISSGIRIPRRTQNGTGASYGTGARGLVRGLEGLPVPSAPQARPCWWPRTLSSVRHSPPEPTSTA